MCVQVFSTVITYFSESVQRKGERKRKKIIISVMSFICTVLPTSSQGMTILCVSLDKSVFINP